MLTIEQFIERWRGNYNRYIDSNDVSAEYRDGYHCGEQEILNFAERHGNSRALKNFIFEKIKYFIIPENEEIYFNGKYCAYREMFEFLINESDEESEEPLEEVVDDQEETTVQNAVDAISTDYNNIAEISRLPYYTREEVDRIIEHLRAQIYEEIYAGENDRRYREFASRIQELQGRTDDLRRTTDYLNSIVGILETN